MKGTGRRCFGGRLPLQRLAVLAILAILAATAGDATAHDRSVSYAAWTVSAAGAEVTVKLDGRDLTRLPESATPSPEADRAVTAAIVGALVSRRGGEACVPASVPARASLPGGRVSFRWRVDCPAKGAFEVESRLGELLGTPHLCFARISLPGSEDVEVVLHRDNARWHQQDGFGPMRTVGQSFLLGWTQVARDIVGLGFFLALVVVASSLPDAAILLIVFALAQSVTFVASTLGPLRSSIASVEGLVALSVVVLAIDNLTARGAAPGRQPATAAALFLVPLLVAAGLGTGRVAILPLSGAALFALCYLGLAARRPGRPRVRALVAIAFGLLHGLSLGSAFAEAAGPGPAVVPALFAFHAGIETAQFLFAATLWCLLGLARLRAGAAYARLVVEPASVVVLATSVAFTVARIFG